MKYLAAAALVAAPSVAGAQAIISNGTIGLGVDRAGQLNISSTNRSTGGSGTIGTTDYGLRDITTNYEGTAQGCLCEGWGAAVSGTGTTVYANNAVGSSFTPVSFTSTGSTATSVVQSTNGALTVTSSFTPVSFTSTGSTATSVVQSTNGALTVTHAFTPSLSSLLYRVDVTITNTSGAAFTGNTLYRRVMDWDIEPTPFNEYSTIQGTAGTANLLGASDNGFASSNPLTARGSILATGDFVDSGPADHGAVFDFSFDPLAAGDSQTLSIYFGAAISEPAALAALGTVGAEVYSFGQAGDDRLGGTANRRTFIFGFKGVGGTALPPSAVPEPASWAMMILGVGAVGATARRRKPAKVAAVA